MTAFHHSDAGTPESTWLLADDWDALPVLDVAALVAERPRVVVASAHPDDEALAVGGLVARLSDAGAEVVVVVATAGEWSHPGSTTWSPDLLATTRRAEVVAAVACLAPRALVVQLDRPDRGLTAAEDDLADELVAFLSADTLLLAPYPDDGHGDHDALGRAAAVAAARVGAALAHYPLWVWHWADPTQFPWERGVVVEPGEAALARKRAAIEEYRSQIAPLGPLPGDEEVITDAMLTRARRTVEVLLVPDDGAPLPTAPSAVTASASSGDSGDSGDPGDSGDSADPADAKDPATDAHADTAAPFDAMFDDTDDPWSASSFYERRKFGLTLGVLGRERYGRILEIGCATGVLTSQLASRGDAVVGMDVSARALERARGVAAQALGPKGARRIEWVRGEAPHDVPDGPFDLVVLSEVGYFLRPTRLLATLRRIRRVLADSGEIVLVHFQHPTSDIPLDGGLVHEQAASVFELPRRARYVDADVAIDVWGEPVSVLGDGGPA